jgi:hypothetical protein
MESEIRTCAVRLPNGAEKDRVWQEARMGLFGWMDERVKRFGIWEMKLAQGAAIFFALIVVKLVPQILTVSVWWFVILAALCAIRPIYVFYGRV